MMVGAPLMAWFFLCPLAASLLSLTASAWLLMQLRHSHGRQSRKLLMRQLWHLALANFIQFFFISIGTVHTMINQFFGIFMDAQGSGTAYMDVMCNVFFSTNIGSMTAMFVEVHIAFAWVAAIYRWRSMLDLLSRSMFFVWPLGILLGCSVSYLDHVHWDISLGMCNTNSLVGENIKGATQTVAFAMCVMVYVAGWVRLYGVAAGSRNRIGIRTQFFVLVICVCWAPLAIYQFASSGELISASSQVVFIVVLTLMNLNGMLNVLIYYALSRARCAHLRPEICLAKQNQSGNAGADQPSFCVGFKEAEIVWLPDEPMDQSISETEY